LRWLKVKFSSGGIAVILLLMQENPAQDWQWLAQHYREIGDEELEELAEDFADLTETAQQVLRNELKNRGLVEPGSKAEAPTRPESSVPWQIAGAVDPDGGLADSGASPGEEDDDSPQVFTWKTPLCECETTDQANQIQAMLKRAGIESWVERPGTRWAAFNPRVVVAADQLEQAQEVAAWPIPQEIIDESKEAVPDFEAPKCPNCGAEDPVLESAEPVNSWLCEACGKQWTEPVAGGEGQPEKTPL
jgi:hypothetical protein